MKHTKQNHRWAVGLTILTMLFFGCQLIEDLNPDDDKKAEKEPIQLHADTVVHIQEAIMDEFISQLVSKDTANALNDVVQAFKGNSNIESLEVIPDGIVVYYSTGLLGAVLVSPGEEEEQFIANRHDQLLEDLSGSVRVSTPGSQKALFLHSNFANIAGYGNAVANSYKTHLDKPKFTLETLVGPQVNVSRFTNLEGYGLIHFFSHGFLYSKNPEKSAYCTGEIFDKFNYTTILAYQPEFQRKEIGFVTKVENGKKQHRFIITPEFIISNNNFRKDSTIMIGGFCYSGTGTWADKMINAGALAYLGFDWRIGATSYQNWTIDMITKMSDTNKLTPITIGSWLDERTRVYTSHTKPDPKNVLTDIVFSGDRNAALWFWEKETDILRVDVDLYIDQASFKFIMSDGSETYGDGAHRAFISSREGTNGFNNNIWKTEFGKGIFGNYSGTMKVTLKGSSADVELTRSQDKNSITETYVINKSGVPKSGALTDASKTVYYQTGTATGSGLSTSYSRVSSNVTKLLDTYACGKDSYFKIEVVYR